MVPGGLARAAVRLKPAAFVGTFVARMTAAMIVSACGILEETGVRASVPPEPPLALGSSRAGGTPVAGAAVADQRARFVTGSGEDREDVSVQVPDRAFLDNSLVAKAASAPGARTAVADPTFPVQRNGKPVTAHWGPTAFTGEKLTAGRALHPGEVVLAGIGLGTRTAVAPLVTMMNGLTGQSPYIPPLVRKLLRRVRPGPRRGRDRAPGPGGPAQAVGSAAC
ncbi:hypothetical protein ABZT43_25830 [Streptomyces sp. NPDC005349]|uniref:hypothetical protein n=1 Tax=Streptomyces sp. NPDC005349 TaxID=3157037 RepID=UPI0033A56F02